MKKYAQVKKISFLEIISKKALPQAIRLELTKKIPEWVKNIFGWYAADQVSEDELLNAIKYLITEEILLVD